MIIENTNGTTTMPNKFKLKQGGLKNNKKVYIMCFRFIFMKDNDPLGKFVYFLVIILDLYFSYHLIQISTL